MIAKRISRPKKNGVTLSLDIVACRRLLAALVKQLKVYDKEVTAYRALFEALQRMTPDVSWPKELTKIQNTRRFRRWLRQKYDQPLGKLLEKIDQQISDQEVRSWLKEWKPTGLKH
ncbi:MAG: hypothetical protein ACRD3H_04410 [Terriglobales bacterium]